MTCHCLFGCPNWSQKKTTTTSIDFELGYLPKTGKQFQCHFKPWMILTSTLKAFGFQIWNATEFNLTQPQDGKPQCWNQSSSRLQEHRKVEAFRFLTGPKQMTSQPATWEDQEYVIIVIIIIIIIIIIMMHTVIMNDEYYCWYYIVISIECISPNF